MLTIVAPKGDSASFAILKHCSPKGIPIMVQHSKMPFNRAVSASGMPLKIIQKRLAIKEIVLPPYCTSLPKGQKAREANLKHCRPMGIPMMVMHQRTPARTQERPCHNPQHRNQMIFPKHPIHFTSRSNLCIACAFFASRPLLFHYNTSSNLIQSKRVHTKSSQLMRSCNLKYRFYINVPALRKGIDSSAKSRRIRICADPPIFSVFSFC